MKKVTTVRVGVWHKHTSSCGSVVPREAIKAVQVGRAVRAGISAMGHKYRKGQIVLHLSSGRSTREVYVLTQGEVESIIDRMWTGHRYRKIVDIRK